MKKITLFVALLCSISAFSTRYLVSITSSSIGTWRAAGTGEVKINYADFSAFYAGITSTSGDEIWLLAGTYNVNVATWSWSTKSGVSFYGGFAGTELATTDRTKVTGGKAWEFSNPTILDGGNNIAYTGLRCNATVSTYFDGLTLQNFKKDGTGAINGVAAYLGTNVIMQNCIVKNNSFVGSTANAGNGAGVYMKGGQLINSYIYNNSCLIGTGTGKASGGAICFNPSPGSKIQGCTIENNSATNCAGGIFLIDWVNPGEFVVDNCIFINNKTLAATDGGGAIGGPLWNTYTAGSKFNITNSQFIGNTTTGNTGGAGISANCFGYPVSISGCTFSGNISNAAAGLGNGGGGLYIQTSYNSAASPVIIDKCVFVGNSVTTDATGAALLTKIVTKMTNCIIVNNSCGFTNQSIVSLQVTNCQIFNNTFAQNSTSGNGGAIDFTYKTTGSMINCLFWKNFNNIKEQNTVSTSYNAFDSSVSGTGNVTSLTATNTFVTPTSFQGLPTTTDQVTELANASWKLITGCPAVDAGTNLTSVSVTTAIDGTPRPQGTAFDMGAYETSVTTATNELANSTVKCYSTNQTIELQALKVGEKVDVYGVTGNLLYSKIAANTSVSIPSASGVFLVRVSGNVSKVLVK